ncbi:hypothetical protein CC78DRAFT_599480 [Lojkania enalia]|uniref:Uncharacterized protein n=1 Tax=Lojkania enalia TaxID=147567 RepID=A0A9P4NBF3_9PLEO|nr:hypothetical protein CC78DRAFT_599480 [Didymosphaeria enalia]
MLSFTTLALLAILAVVSAVPITPSAPEQQRRAERLRYEGVPEREIAEQLSLPMRGADIEGHPFYSHVNDRFPSFFRSPSELEKRDVSGDIAPGSLEAPQMLPQAAAPESLADTISQAINALLKGEDYERRNFGYEGKELELRRPKGMRYWG